MQARLETVNLLSKSPAQLRDFYRDVFDFEELDYKSDPPELYVLDGKGCRLCIKNRPVSTGEKDTQPIELCIEVEDLLQTMKGIKDHGGTILPDEPFTNSGVAFYADDPEGHHLLVEYVYREDALYYY